MERNKNEIQKKDAELQALLYLVHPHFLLNTLNNIYALIAFDPEKAQCAVMSLSHLLRKILYGELKEVVNIQASATFIGDYIDLMRIRQTDNVKIEYNVSLPDPCNVRIVPFLLISLVENAFKHGISPTQPSFIRINLTANEERISCYIENSNYPKSKSDQSGHGIGLEQVQQRLDSSYPGKYEWTKGVDENNTYFTKLTIYDTQMLHY